jgi:hypothetical protein
MNSIMYLFIYLPVLNKRHVFEHRHHDGSKLFDFDDGETLDEKFLQLSLAFLWIHHCADLTDLE